MLERPDDTHDVQRLEIALGDIRDLLHRITADERLEELIPIWRRPGWTTPAEFVLVEGVLSTIHDQVLAVHKTVDVLLEGSRLVEPH
jgi:hypothetical protein